MIGQNYAECNFSDNYSENLLPPALIQVNKLIVFKIGDTKIYLKRITGKYNFIENWKTISVTVSELADILKAGYAVRSGVKVGGNEKEHVTRCNWLFLDFDNLTRCEWENILKSTAWVSSVCLWYYTPSYVVPEVESPDDLVKVRLVFRLDRDLSADEYEHVYKALQTFYPDADNTSAAGNIFYGASKCPHAVKILSETAILPTEPFLTMGVAENLDARNNDEDDTPPQTTQHPALELDEGIRGSVLKWLSKSVWVEKCNSNNIEKLYCLHSHGFVESGVNSWSGHRPEDKSKNTGTGFYVFWKNPEYLPMFQNQGEAKIKDGTFIDYWHHYGNLLHNKNWGSIVWQDDQQYTEYQKVCDDVADHFDIPRFDFDSAKAAIKKRRQDKKEENKQKQNQQTTDLIEQVKEILSQYCRLVTSGAKDSYLYYSFNAGVWKVKALETNVFRDCVKYSLINHYGHSEEIFDNAKVVTPIIACIKNFGRYQEFANKSDFDDFRNQDIVPLTNGDYNWRTKEFTTAFNPGNYNMTRSTKSYYPLTGDEPGVKFFKYWLSEMGYSPNQRRAIESWLIVNCLGIATRTKRMFCIYGTPETGKTVIGQILQGCLKSQCVTENGNTLTDTSNRFANQSLEGAYAVFIDEFRTDAKGWESIKKFTGNAAITLPIEKKGMSSYNAAFYGGVTTATQDKFILPNSDDGGIRRRVVLLKHTPEMHKPHLNNVDITFADPAISQDIYNWAIQQHGDKAVADFIEYAKSDDAKLTLQESLLESDDVLQFMSEMIVFTDDKNDVVSRTDLQVAYEVWLQQELGKDTNSMKTKISQISHNIVQKASIPDNKIFWTLCPINKEKKVIINGKQVRGLSGIRIRHSDNF